MSIDELRKFLQEFFVLDEEKRSRADKEMSEFTLRQLYLMIDLEIGSRKSFTVLQRLHRRLSKLRMLEEREALQANVTAWRR